MVRMLCAAILAILAAAAVACGSPEVRKDGPTTRDRANESFQNLQQEEDRQAPEGK